MPNDTATTDRISRNTAALYLKALVTVAISLYTVRLALGVLGVENYGIYHLVAGLSALLSFLPSAMASTTQRYFAFEIGCGNSDKLKALFSTNIILYLIISAFAFATLHFAGNWILTEYINIPKHRQSAAHAAFQLTIISLSISILTAPLMAIIIAHENMFAISIIAIAEALLLLILIATLKHHPGDSLVAYARITVVASALSLLSYLAYTTKKYPECKFRITHFRLDIMKSLVSYTGWALFGQLTTAARNHGVTLLLGQYYNPAIVAARSIAVNVASRTSIFSHNLNLGLYPPIVKYYATSDINNMSSLVFSGSKLTFYLTWIVTLPLLVEMEAILTIWLGSPPEHSVLFTRLALIESLIFSFSMPMTTAARAPGKIQGYELILGITQLTILPASWLALNAGISPSTVFWIGIAINIVMLFIRMGLTQHLTGIPAIEFGKTVFAPTLKVAAISFLLSIISSRFFSASTIAAVASVGICITVTAITTYFIGLTHTQRSELHSWLKKSPANRRHL